MHNNRRRYRGRAAASRGRGRGDMLSHNLQALCLSDDDWMCPSSPLVIRGNCRQRSSAVAAGSGIGTFEFSVASYNILDPDLLEEHSYMYGHCDERNLRWSYRKQNIMRQLNNNSPDIICLQEVPYSDFVEFFLPRLQQRGYTAEYKQKTGHRTDGCATFYKQKKFICCNSVPVDLYVDGCAVLDRPNVALLMLLEPVVQSRQSRSSACVCVANTHLLYNPDRGDVKLAQLMFMFAAIDEVAGISDEPCPTYHPIVLCGDLNLEPFSSLYDFVVGGSLHYEGLSIRAMSGQKHNCGGRRLSVEYFLPPSVDVTDFCQFFDITQHRRRARRCRQRWKLYDESFCSGVARHSLNLVSAYNDTSPDAMTTWHGDRCRGAVVDYIFYSAERKSVTPVRRGRSPAKNMMSGLLKLSHVLQLPTQEHVRRSGGLPNDRESSDHLMLMAWFTMTTSV